jgi:hypothetical protein
MSSKKNDSVDETQDDPLGIGVSSSNLYIILGICICLVLLSIIGVIFWMRSSSSSDEGDSGNGDVDGGEGDGDGDCGIKIPSHFTVEFKYGEGVNPYNNFALPPVLPKPPEFFGS